MNTFLKLVGVVVACAAVTASERKIDRKALPAAVEAAVKQEEARGATVKNIIEEQEKGQTTYEVETVKDGRGRDLIFDKAGKVVETEDEVAIDSLPAAARAAIEKSGKVLKVERVLHGSTVTYEAEIEKGGKKSEVAVDAAGKRIKS